MARRLIIGYPTTYLNSTILGAGVHIFLNVFKIPAELLMDMVRTSSTQLDQSQVFACL